MIEIFFEKYSSKYSLREMKLQYSHKTQTNNSSNINYLHDTTITRVKGEATDEGHMFGETVITEVGGEATDQDEILNSSTHNTDTSGEATDEDLFLLVDQEKTAVGGEASS